MVRIQKLCLFASIPTPASPMAQPIVSISASLPQLDDGAGGDYDYHEEPTDACFDFCDESAEGASSDLSAVGSAPATPLHVSHEHFQRSMPEMVLADLDGPIRNPLYSSVAFDTYQSSLVRLECFAGDRDLTSLQRSESFSHGIFATIADLRRNFEEISHLAGGLQFLQFKDGRLDVLSDGDFILPGSTTYMRPTQKEMRMRLSTMQLELRLLQSHVNIIISPDISTGQLVDALLSKISLTRETGSLYFFLPSGTPVLLRPSVFHLPARLWRDVPGGAVLHPAVNGPVVNLLTVQESRLFCNSGTGYAIVLHDQDVDYRCALVQAMVCDPAGPSVVMDNNEYDHSLSLSQYYHRKHWEPASDAQ